MVKTETPGVFKNQPAYDENGKYIGWVSRSMAVFCCVLAQDKDNNIYVLGSQRGTGTPDPELVGKWNCITGYLDFNETIRQAACREAFEETGVEVKPEELTPFDIDNFVNDDPKGDKRQNVTFRFYAMLEKTIDKYKFSKANNEKNEVGEIKWIPIEYIDNYQWAFNHDRLIHMVQGYLNSYYI